MLDSPKSCDQKMNQISRVTGVFKKFKPNFNGFCNILALKYLVNGTDPL